jgi:hypothetical protein
MQSLSGNPSAYRCGRFWENVYRSLELERQDVGSPGVQQKEQTEKARRGKVLGHWLDARNMLTDDAWLNSPRAKRKQSDQTRHP